MGQIPTALNGVGGFQDSSGIGHTVNAEGLWRAISKDVRVISDPATFWTDLREVVESVLSPRPGPGVLLIAKDVFSLTVPPRPADWPTDLSTMRAGAQPRPSMLRDLIERLGRAKAPLDGGGSRSAGWGRSGPAGHAGAADADPCGDDAIGHQRVSCGRPALSRCHRNGGHPSAHGYMNDVADLVIVVGSSLEIMQRAPVMAGLSRADLVFVCSDVSLCGRTFPRGHAHRVRCPGVHNGVAV